jgi:predicted O-methyltransferase YrrM
MFATTSRQQKTALLLAVAGLIAAGAALAGFWRIAVAVLALLLVAAVFVLLDIRRRSAGLSQRLAELTALVDARDRPPQGPDTGAALERLAAAAEATRKLVKRQPQEIEALLHLYSRVEPRDAMPAAGQWSLNPRGLLDLYMLVQRYRPRLVMELGSGTSTVWLGYALAETGSGRLVSVDHDAMWAARTRDMVGRHESAVAPTEVRHAPLTAVDVGGQRYRWYQPEALADVDHIDLLVVDGPPSRTGEQARYPAVPALLARLAPGALIVLDDAARGDEKAVIARWVEEVPGLVREPSGDGRQAVLRYAPDGRTGSHTQAGTHEVATHG